MPFTPFHMGPGIMVKALTGHYFSLTVFGFSQIVIDIEPLVRILRGDEVIHGFSHTYVGALIIGLFSLLAGKPFCEWVVNIWNQLTGFKFLLWLQVQTRLSWFAATTGAFIGTFSHVLLDSIMHSDMHPLSPFSYENGLLNLMPAGWLYMLCAVLGVFGVIVFAVLTLWNKWAIQIE